MRGHGGHGEVKCSGVRCAWTGGQVDEEGYVRRKKKDISPNSWAVPYLTLPTSELVTTKIKGGGTSTKERPCPPKQTASPNISVRVWATEDFGKGKAFSCLCASCGTDMWGKKRSTVVAVVIAVDTPGKKTPPPFCKV